MPTLTDPDRIECPHCHKQLPAESIADDFSGCPLAVKRPSPPGYLGADPWPVERDDDDDDDGVAPVSPKLELETA